MPESQTNELLHELVSFDDINGDGESSLSAAEGSLRNILRDFSERNFSHEEMHYLLVAANDVQRLNWLQSAIDLLRDRSAADSRDAMEQLIDLCLPRIEPRQAPDLVDQARRNAELRKEFLTEFPCWDAEHVHQLYGSTADNRSALTAGWRKARKIFGIEYRNKLRFPAFQFDGHGRPRPVIARVLKAMNPDMGPWQIAIWFTSANSSLDGQTPVHILDTHGEDVVRAAEALSQPNLF